MDLIETACPVCDSPRRAYYARAKSLYGPEEFDHWLCSECSHVYVSPRIRAKEEEIRERPAVREIFSDEAMAASLRRARLKVRKYAALVPAGAKVLDIGAGTGALIKALLDIGVDAFGLELNRETVRLANAFWGFDRVAHGACREGVSRFGDCGFDIVNASQVVEHMENPVGELSAAIDLLKPGGIFLCDVPNIRGYRERLRRGSTLDPTAHLQNFTRSSLTRLLERSGYLAVRVEAPLTGLGVRERCGPLVGAAAGVPVLVLRPFHLGMTVYGRARCGKRVKSTQ